MPGKAGQGLPVIGRGRIRPRRDRTRRERLLLIGHDELGVEIHRGAEPVAGRAGAEGLVEGEQPWLDFVDREAGDRTGRSEERRVGEEGVSTCSSWWSPDPLKKKTTK